MWQMLASLLVSVLLVQAEREKRDDLVYNGLAESDYFFGNLSKHFTNVTSSMIISPYSLHSALTQTAALAGGPSADEMLQVLGLFYTPWQRISSLYDSPSNMLRNEYYNNGIQIFDWTLLIACGTKILQLRAINSPYIQETPMFNKKRVPCINPEAIRSYLESKTDDNIVIEVPPNLLTQGSMLLLNTMAVQAEWKDKFYRGKTKKHKFESLYPKGFWSTTVDMMTSVLTVQWKRDEKLKVDVVEIPLKGSELGFYIVLPHENRGIFNVEKELLDSGLAPYDVTDGLTATVVKLMIPKFTINTESNLKQVLQDMGIILAFGEKTADFRQISYWDNYYLSAVIYTAGIKIKEEGISPSKSALRRKLDNITETLNPVQSFVAERPFSFFIRHNYLGRVLLYGRFTGW